MKFQVVMTVEIPDEDTLHDKYDMTQADKALPAVREWFANTYRRPVTVTEARYIENAGIIVGRVNGYAALQERLEAAEADHEIECDNCEETILESERWYWHPPLSTDPDEAISVCRACHRAALAESAARAEAAERLASLNALLVEALENIVTRIEEREVKFDGGGGYEYVLNGSGYPDHRHKNGTEQLLRDTREALARVREGGA